MQKITKRVALIAHDSKKEVLADWVERNAEALKPHQLFATETTGGVLLKRVPDFLNYGAC